MVYFDDGKFRLRTFDRSTRTKEQIDSNDVNINDILGIDNFTMVVQQFPDPFITCCFCDDDTLYVNLKYRDTDHYHFLWDIPSNKMKGNSIKVEMDTTMKNFPYKCFYNDDLQEIYSFYRQGQYFVVDRNNVAKYETGTCTD